MNLLEEARRDALIAIAAGALRPSFNAEDMEDVLALAAAVIDALAIEFFDEEPNTVPVFRVRALEGQ